MFKLTFRLDADRVMRMTLNTPGGAIGYSTEDTWEANFEFIFHLDVLDRIKELTGFEVGIMGLAPKVTVFKTT